MYLLIEPATRLLYAQELDAMHRLRHRIFIDELKWPLDPIRSENGREYDQFDDDRAHYILRLNAGGDVDACVRLLPTDGPYLLGDVFAHMVTAQPVPRSASTWEISRFCADRDTAPSTIVAEFCAAIVEFAVDRGISTIVSCSDVRIEPIIRRSGWLPVRLGAPVPTGTDTAVGLSYSASQAILDRIRSKSGITDRLLPLPPHIPEEHQQSAIHAA